MRAVCRSDLSKAVVLAHDNRGRFKPFQTNISINFFLSSFVVCIHAYNVVHVSFFPNKRIPMLKSFLSKAQGLAKSPFTVPSPTPLDFHPALSALRNWAN